MARLASGGEVNRTSNFLSTRTESADDKLSGLLASLDPKTREMIHALAKEPMEVRAGVLAELDPDTRAVFGLLLDHLS